MSFATLSDPGTERGDNEDACGVHEESATSVLVAVADGVSGEEGGEVASQMAIEVTLRAYRESPAAWGPAKRLYRAVQQANIEIYDRAQVVTELRRMATTLTAAVVDGGTLHAAHVGDSRLYLLRGGAITQKTKDHTLAADRRLTGLGRRGKDHPDRSILTRSLGRELIAAVDRLTFPLAGGDVLLLCSDGLYNVLDDQDLLAGVSRGASPEGPGDLATACGAIVGAANERGTPDNLTVALARVLGDAPERPPNRWKGLLSRWLGG